MTQRHLASLRRPGFAIAPVMALLAMLGTGGIARANPLDDVHDFLSQQVAGRTMYREAETLRADKRVRSENWFVMTNVARSTTLISYEILFTARYVADTGVETETAHFYCRLGLRSSTGRVLGYCAPNAATRRPIDGKAWTVVATLESPTRLLLEEEITLYQDVADPGAAGSMRPGTGSSRITIERTPEGLVMTEHATRWTVDPRTLARQPAGAPIQLVSRQLNLSERVENATGAPRTSGPEQGSQELDRVYAWFANRIVGRELTWSDRARGITNWFTISNLYRSGTEMRYDILYRSRRPAGLNDESPRSWRMEQVHWSCALGARRTTGDVLGFCRTLAATDRDLVAKASAISASVRGETLELRESTVDFIDVKDPRSGTLVPGATESRIVIERDNAGQLQMSETSTIYRVDPATRARSVIRPASTAVMREQAASGG